MTNPFLHDAKCYLLIDSAHYTLFQSGSKLPFIVPVRTLNGTSHNGTGLTFSYDSATTSSSEHLTMASTTSMVLQYGGSGAGNGTRGHPIIVEDEEDDKVAPVTSTYFLTQRWMGYIQTSIVVTIISSLAYCLA